MKFLLINPLYSYFSLNKRLDSVITNIFAKGMKKTPSLALLTIAGMTPEDIDVEYLDENLGNNINYNDDVDLIGITYMTPQTERAYEIADKFRSMGKVVILGGIHATVLEREAKEHADSVVVGEVEEMWEDIISDFRKGKLKEFYHGGHADLTKSRTPKYELLASYDFSNMPLLSVPLQFTRGCPRNCEFCLVTHVYGKKCRTKSLDQINLEIEEIYKNLEFENMVLWFNDANPFVNRNFAKKFLKELIPHKIKWTASVDISIASDPELLDLVQKSGCVCLAIGFESLSETVLDEISPWKKKQLKNYPKFIRTIREKGIAVAGNIILGLHSYSNDYLNLIRDFVIDNRIVCQYTIITPFPGTPIYDRYKKEGRLRDDLSWRYYNAYNAVFDSKNDAEKIAEDLSWLYEETWKEEVLSKATIVT